MNTLSKCSFHYHLNQVAYYSSIWGYSSFNELNMVNELERKVSCVWSENLSIIFDFKPRLVFAAEMIFPSSRQGKNFWNVGQRIFKDKVMLRSSHRGSFFSTQPATLGSNLPSFEFFSDGWRLSSLLKGPLALFSTQEDQQFFLMAWTKVMLTGKPATNPVKECRKREYRVGDLNYDDVIW